LIIFRIAQGLGGGGLQPSEQAILADTFPPEKRGMAFAVYGMAVVLAPAIGPTLGGFITDHASWRWIFFINVPVGVVSLLLTSRLVEDPPWARRRAGLRIDYVGLALLSLGLGALQLVLDKGEREDWFDSAMITGFAIVSAASLISVIVYEWRRKDPILELHLLRHRNFAISFALMFMLGAILLGTTVLLPQVLQLLLGYTAQQAGMTLSPGGLVVIALLPLVGKLLGRVSARWLIAFGVVALGVALEYLTTHLYLGIDFKTAVVARVYQAIGLAFLFVPINTVSYFGVPPEKNNQISALINMARNIGGGVGISLVTTLIARRAQVHQSRLVEHLTPYHPAVRAALHKLAALLHGTAQAQARLYAQAVRQATMLAYVDAVRVLTVGAVLMLPLVLALRQRRPAAGAARPTPHRAAPARPAS
jgi:MFS transporter, DHA2 family, multidrug resistance protein